MPVKLVPWAKCPKCFVWRAYKSEELPVPPCADCWNKAKSGYWPKVLRPFPELPPYEVPEQDRDLWDVGVVLGPDDPERYGARIPSKFCRMPLGPSDQKWIMAARDLGQFTRRELAAKVEGSYGYAQRKLCVLHHHGYVRRAPVFSRETLWQWVPEDGYALREEFFGP